MLMQIAFHAADMVVVGRFVSAHAMAAVGSTGALTALCITLLTGLSVGTSVLTAQYYGAKNWNALRNILRTAIAVALLGGLLMASFGFFFARTLLSWMRTPPEVIELSKLYLWIIFGGMPFQMTYIFGSSIMRALGDTKRPLFFLSISGTANVLLNLFFVLVFKMGVSGVAFATVISNAISSTFILRVLSTYEPEFRLNLKKLRIYWDSLYRMARIGLPSSCGSSCFSLSNIIIQSSVNSLGATTMAGNAAALQYENVLYLFSSYTLHLASVSFVGQNYGGGQYKRIIKSI
ncbi:MAG: MATE family efflux transporter, partial [Victivallales bacterium]|nr:MATE family efflux transporter [Victivallales bacterium]